MTKSFILQSDSLSNLFVYGIRYSFKEQILHQRERTDGESDYAEISDKLLRIIRRRTFLDGLNIRQKVFLLSGIHIGALFDNLKECLVVLLIHLN